MTPPAADAIPDGLALRRLLQRQIHSARFQFCFDVRFERSTIREAGTTGPGVHSHRPRSRVAANVDSGNTRFFAELYRTIVQ